MTNDKNLTFSEQCKNETKLDRFGARHTLAIMGFLGVAFNLALRFNLSVAIVAMVNQTTSKDNSSEAEVCPATSSNNSSEETDDTTGEFNWDEDTQGLILGSFYYGYVLTNIIGGVATEYFGGRLIVGLSITLMSLMTLLSPLGANVSSGLFIALRILEGCAAGVFYPSMYFLITSWYPKSERSKFSSFIWSGMELGTVVTLVASGLLSSSEFLGGWPSAFYTFGIMALIWAFFWAWLIRDNPEDHPSISKNELKYIIEGCPRKEHFPTPWKSILSSKYFWIITITQFGQAWGYYTFFTEIPTYLDKIHHIDIKKNGMFTALPEAGAFVFTNIVGVSTDRLLAKGTLSLLSVRRISMIIGGYGPVICLIIMCFVDCNTTLALVILFLNATIGGAVLCGYACSYGDISPRFAPAIVGISNTFAGIPGFVAPLLTGIIISKEESLWSWRKVFLTSAIFYLVTTTIYIFFITTETQPWNEPKQKQNGKDQTKQ